MSLRLPLVLCVLLPAGAAVAQDSDGDGVADVADVFPCDDTASAVAFEPSEGGYGTIVFEDQWPLQGDLDFNDLSIAYHFTHARDAAGRVTRIRALLHARAMGGMLDLGVGLRLPVPRGAALRVQRTIGGVTEALVPSTDDAQLTVILSNNMREVFGGAAGQINSLPEQPALASQTLVVDIELATATAIEGLHAPYDLFILRTAAPGHEIHRPEFGGTARMNTALFGTGDDASTEGRRFVDRDGLPFALVFPALVDHPIEAEEISRLWPRVTAFAASGGATNRDFYLNDVDAAFAFSDAPVPPALPVRATVHQELGSCLEGPRACAVPNGAGTHSWTGSAWSACQATTCAAGYHLEDLACASDTRACAIPNGIGAQTWASGAWSGCALVSCTSGHASPSGTSCVVPRSCNDALQRGFTTTGIYSIDPDGDGGLPAFPAYCEMTLGGGGWTLLFNRRAGNLSIESCGNNLTQFLQAGCGTPSAIGDADSYALTGGQRLAVPTTQILVTQYLDGVLDADDAYVVDLSVPGDDLFPDTDASSNIPLRGACNLAGTACDSHDVFWKYIGDFWYHSSRCMSASSGSALYRGNYGLCTEGASNDDGNSASYPSSMAFGDRLEYAETKLWGHPGSAVAYQERVWARDAETCPSCAASSCGAGNHLEGVDCLPNTRTCAIPNGTGTQTWEPVSWYSRGGGWGTACLPASCDDGYRLSDSSCVLLTYTWTTGAWGTCGGGTAAQTYSVWGSCTGGSGTWSYGAWGSCSASSVCSGSGTQSRSSSCNGLVDSGSQARTGSCVWTAGTGSQARDLSCVNNFGEAADGALCGAAPATTQACTPGGTPATCGAFSTTQACTPTATSACGVASTSQSCQSPAGSQSCPIANGTGTQSCAAGSSSWDSCTRTACNPGYVASGNACITDTGPNSCLAIRNAGQTTSGYYSIDPDGLGAIPTLTVYCDMTTNGGGWTLISNRRAGSTNTEACGSNVMQFFTNGCGNVASIAASDSYALSQSLRNAIPKTQMLVTQFLNGALDSDDAYIVVLSSANQDLFPNTNASQNIPLNRVCDVNMANCDTTDVFWKYIGDFWYHSSMCFSDSSGSTSYRGNYGVCHAGARNDGASGAYSSSSAFGDRVGYAETKLWAHPNGAASYQERIWAR